MIRTALLTGLAATIGVTCDNPPTERPAQVIFVGESHSTPFDARPGDTIIVVMDGGGDPLARCDDMGGELIYNPHTLLFTCEGVDF